MSLLSAMRDSPVRVLVVKLSSLGDIIHATGCFRSIRAALPRAHISLAVEARWSGAVRHDPHLDALVRSSASSSLTLAYALEVRQLVASHGPFDVALDLQGNRRSAAWTYLSGAPIRVGRGSFRPGWQLALKPDLTRHAVEVCADICRAAGIPVSDPSPELHACANDEATLDRILDDRGLPRSGFVIINPFSRWRSKSVPLTTVSAIMRRLISDAASPLVLSGGLEDTPGCERLLGTIRGYPVQSLVGQLSLGEALCLYRRARLMVSCDSGPMHAAAALGVPVVALFGPTHPERTGPWGRGHTVIQSMRPARHHAYRHDPECVHMRSIDSEVVMDAVLSELRRGAAS